MERQQEPTPSLNLEQALWSIHEGQMLQFTANGFRIYEYVETDETRIETMKFGESEHVFRVPVKKLVLQIEASSSEELFSTHSKREPYSDGRIAYTIDTEEFRAWVESLVTPKDVKEAAVKELERREADGDTETMPCTNCRGEMYFEGRCSCTHGGTTFMDLTEETKDSVVKLRQEGIADPDCETCGGTGIRRNECPYCEGCGQTAKYPIIILKNEITDEKQVLKLDLAALVASGEVEVEWGGYEKLYPDDYQVGEKIIRFTVPDYINRNISEMGIDIDNTVRIQQERVSKIESGRAVIGRRAYWRKHKGEIQTGFNHGEEAMNASEVLLDAQIRLARDHAWPYGKIKNDQGVVVAEEWIMRPLRPFEEALEDIKTVLARYGYTLGYALSFIATGETGPSFFLLDSNGNALEQLSNDYYIRESLENAWLAIQKIKESLPGTGQSKPPLQKRILLL